MVESVSTTTAILMTAVMEGLSALAELHKLKGNAESQRELAELSHERQKEVKVLEAGLSSAAREGNFEREKELQLKLKALESKLMWKTRAGKRENSLRIIEKRKRSDGSPIWMVPDQIFSANPTEGLIPLRVFLSLGQAPDSEDSFPKNYLADQLLRLFKKYSDAGRPVIFFDSAWEAKAHYGRNPISALFDVLKDVPTLILESSVEDGCFHLHFAYWGLNQTAPLYESFISKLSWPDASDSEETRRFVSLCHCLLGGMLADRYFLTDFPPSTRSHPLLPMFLPELLKGLPLENIRKLTSLIISCYRHLYESLSRNNESCWIPELHLALGRSFMTLDGPWAEEQFLSSVKEWLRLHGLPQARGLDTLLDRMASSMNPADATYVDQLNQCLADACHIRGIRHCQNRNYELAIPEFDHALQLNAEWAVACCSRGNAHYELGMYEEAVADYDRALEINPIFAEPIKKRQTALDEINRRKEEERRRYRGNLGDSS